MKKAINQAYGDVNQIKIVAAEMPKLSKNEVLVKVSAAGLNPKDILVRKGKFKQLTGKRFPQGIGFEFAGFIEDANGTNYQKGEKVFGMVNGWDGRCCATYVNIAASELYRMPEATAMEDMAGLSLVGQTSLQAIRNIGKLSSGKKILINGASRGVGTIAIQIAKELGGVVTTVSSTKNLAFCQAIGADVALSYQEQALVDLQEKYDVFYDVFGNYNFQKIKGLLTSKGIYITTVPKATIIKEQF